MGEVLSGLRDEFDHLQEQRDRDALSAAASVRIGSELVLRHLIMHVADGLDNLWLEAYLR